MAGLGPAPKPADRRARVNKDPVSTTNLTFQRCDPPELPDDYDWHPQTRRWWTIWQQSPMASIMGPTDWAFMIDTALMHDAMWSKKQWTLAAEVRLRVAKFGATPEDRLRLRIQWADADDKDAKRNQTVSIPDRVNSRYAGLRVVQNATEGGSAS